MKKPIAASLLLLMLVLPACSNFRRPSPTANPTLTLTFPPSLAPASTFVSPEDTPEVVSSPLPEGQLVSEWNGIPIMPDAITGEGDEESYVFTVKATPQQVQEYYQLELAKLGWQAIATGDGDSSLTFTNNASITLTISMIAKGDQVLVLLVQ